MSIKLNEGPFEPLVSNLEDTIKKGLEEIAMDMQTMANMPNVQCQAHDAMCETRAEIITTASPHLR